MREAIQGIDLDITEGVDMVMVKVTLAYLDIIYPIKQPVHLSIAAYNVDREYALIKTAATAKDGAWMLCELH